MTLDARKSMLVGACSRTSVPKFYARQAPISVRPRRHSDTPALSGANQLPQTFVGCSYPCPDLTNACLLRRLREA